MHRSNLHVCVNSHVESLHLSSSSSSSSSSQSYNKENISGLNSTSDAIGSWQTEKYEISKDKWPLAHLDSSSASSPLPLVVCDGVLLRDPNSPHGTRLIRARKEVILAAGAIGSPHLLQCSGIGPSDLLKSKGVKPLVPLEGVGRNLQVTQKVLKNKKNNNSSFCFHLV